MISQGLKDLWYLGWSPILRGNLYRHRLLNGHGKHQIKLNLGSGTTHFQGWINIDGNFMHHPDMWLDVRHGLPFQDQSVHVIYASHFFEHLYLTELKPLLKECRRVLKNEGLMRIAVPNLESAIVAYQNCDSGWFSTFPVEFRSLGGRFFNEMLCGDQHRLMFDFTFLEEILFEIGFQKVAKVVRGESTLLPRDDEALCHEQSSDSGKQPDPWLLVEAMPI